MLLNLSTWRPDPVRIYNRCKAWLDPHLKSSKYLEPVRKRIQDAIGKLTTIDIKTKEDVWDWIAPLLSK
jgi:hypothetical protein